MLQKREPPFELRNDPRMSAPQHACAEPGCIYVAARADTLARHLRAHTGERPYGCEEPGCDFAAAESGTLAKHVLRMHAPPQRPPAAGKRARAPSPPAAL